MSARICLLTVVSTTVLTVAALAQTADEQTRPPEILVTAKDGTPRCEPQELRVPADAHIDLRVQNQGGRSVVVRAPDLFGSDRVRGATNATKEGDGYMVAGHHNGQMIVHTPPQGQYRFACADQGAVAGEMAGTLVTVKSMLPGAMAPPKPSDAPQPDRK
jgi:cupredoxin-like protein